MKTKAGGEIMNKRSVLILIGIFIGVSSGVANVLLIDPSDDGSIYSNGDVSNSAYLMADGAWDVQAVVEFPLNDVENNVISAQLSLNPYGLPLHDKTVDVFGYSSGDGELTSADYNAGTFIGTLTLSDDLDFGEDSFFDVTDFINSISSDYVGFNLRTTKLDVFSSLEYNYGHPAQLVVQNIPEPASLGVICLVTAGIFFTRRFFPAVS